MQGDEVEFMVTKTTKGFQGVNVMKVGSQKVNAESSDDVENSEALTNEAVDSVVRDTKEGEDVERGLPVGINSDEGDGVNQKQLSSISEVDKK